MRCGFSITILQPRRHFPRYQIPYCLCRPLEPFDSGYTAKNLLLILLFPFGNNALWGFYYFKEFFSYAERAPDKGARLLLH